MNTATLRWRPILAAALAVLGLAATVFLVRSPVVPSASGTAASAIPAPTLDEPASGRPKAETAVLAGGCFWGVQGVYQHVKGVQSAQSGYAGGDAATANYDAVTTETTGHAESVRITYDPTQVSYGKLLQIFFAVVQDPTELNRQGPDVGPSYRSAIFAQDDTQQKIANAYIAQLNAAGVISRADCHHRVAAERSSSRRRPTTRISSTCIRTTRTSLPTTCPSWARSSQRSRTSTATSDRLHCRRAPIACQGELSRG